MNGDAVLLRTWSDEYQSRTRQVGVFGKERRPGGTTSAGLNERKDHLRALWNGGQPAYAVIVTPVDDKTDGVRKIGDFRSDAVFPIDRLIEDQATIYAQLGAPVPVDKLQEHMRGHRVAGSGLPLPTILLDASGPEPKDAAEKTAYKAAGMREYLIDAARRKSKVTYGELFDAFDLNRLTVAKVLSMVGHSCLANKEPILTALAVLKGTGRCSTGMEREFGVDEDEERVRVFAHWAPNLSRTDERSGDDWLDEELRATVEAYWEMQRLDALGTPFVKAHYYRRLSERFGRVEGAFERRMQNISALLDARGLPWLEGLKPQTNTGANVEARLAPLLEDLFAALTPPIQFAEELDAAGGVVEGAKRQITVNAYERDPTAKPRCIKRWGSTCVVCGFNFGVVYGELGDGFIHVHHLKPIHTIGEEYVLDPENDLRPVCPNCHSMLHRQKETLSIEELKAQLKLTFKHAFAAKGAGDAIAQGGPVCK
ncbi:HNH endonuclease [Cupriavidus basilensis]|uniref:HNH endonuclease n=1 Tax=Cupriavidus basilensis TaxID=68895 RepID=UPI0020A658C2|nr:HNH endonuclease [Cupriavidus basilensis]MCP3023363.1 HNH endonuclease [Cupriavidus basilensis]